MEPSSPGLEAQLLIYFDLDPQPVVTTPSLNVPTIPNSAPVNMYLQGATIMGNIIIKVGRL